MTRVVDFNNTRSHAEVIAMFDRAIAAEQQRLGLIEDKIGSQVQALLDSALTSARVLEPV